MFHSLVLIWFRWRPVSRRISPLKIGSPLYHSAALASATKFPLICQLSGARSSSFISIFTWCVPRHTSPPTPQLSLAACAMLMLSTYAAWEEAFTFSGINDLFAHSFSRSCAKVVLPLHICFSTGGRAPGSRYASLITHSSSVLRRGFIALCDFRHVVDSITVPPASIDMDIFLILAHFLASEDTMSGIWTVWWSYRSPLAAIGNFSIVAWFKMPYAFGNYHTLSLIYISFMAAAAPRFRRYCRVDIDGLHDCCSAKRKRSCSMNLRHWLNTGIDEVTRRRTQSMRATPSPHFQCRHIIWR